MSETGDEVTSVTGPVEKRDGQLVLRIPWHVGGEQLAHAARGISSVTEDHLEVRIPDWLAEKLGIAEGSLVDVDNADGKLNLAPHGEDDLTEN